MPPSLTIGSQQNPEGPLSFVALPQHGGSESCWFPKGLQVKLFLHSHRLYKIGSRKQPMDTHGVLEPYSLKPIKAEGTTHNLLVSGS